MFAATLEANAGTDALNLRPLPDGGFPGGNPYPGVSLLAQAKEPDPHLDMPPKMRPGSEEEALQGPRSGVTTLSPAPNANDEIMALLRQSDPAFTGDTIDLPTVEVESLDDSVQVPFLNLDQVIDLALHNSYSYAATVAQADQADYAAKVALGQMGPTLDLRTQKGTEYSAPASIRDENGNIVQSYSHMRWDMTLIARQPIFAPGSFFDYAKQRAMLQAADMRRDDARESLYYTTIKAYYDVLRAYAALSFARSYGARMDELLDYMRKRLEGGGASKIDYERVRGRLLMAQATVAEAEGTLESTLVSLAQLTGKRVMQVQVPARMMPTLPSTSRQALKDVYETNPGIRAARRDADAARQELNSARAKFSPTLAVEVTESKTRYAGGDPTLNKDRRIMLVLTMNLLNGGSDIYYQSQIGAKFREKSNTADDLERKLKEQIEINYRTLGAVQKRMEISRQAYEANANVADVFLEQLATGSKQLLDVLDAYQQAYQARMDFALLLFQQADLSYQILRNTGRAWTPAGETARDGK
jgi:outer membrane protein, adhesin transport system